MAVTRRGFLSSCSTAAAACLAAPALAPSLARAPGSRSVTSASGVTPVDPALVKSLASSAIDAARDAGASYADVRVTRTLRQNVSIAGAILGLHDDVGIGVRCLVDGYWGFAASAVWTIDEAAQLARDAAAQARALAKGGRRAIELGSAPTVTGHWTMPGIDPFSISMEEKMDFHHGLERYTNASGGVWNPTMAGPEYRREEQAIATSDGTYVTQTLYRIGAPYAIGYDDGNGIGNIVMGRGSTPEIPFRHIGLAGAGWDRMLDARLFDQVPACVAASRALAGLPVKAVDVGRYDVVMDAETTASLIDATIGKGTELDRAVGYEANAGGTSFLGPNPLELLGAFRVGAPSLTVTANRFMERGVATVRWDAEGLVPRETTLVADGVLVDYQTTREQAAWLAPWYQTRGTSARSQGNAGAESALAVPIQARPNLVLVPGQSAATMDDLIGEVKRGIALYRGNISTDFQARNGWGGGVVAREIVNGKLGARVQGVGIQFATVELWKNLVALGGAASADSYGFEQTKGEPAQRQAYTVRAVPALFRNVAVVDPARKA